MKKDVCLGLKKAIDLLMHRGARLMLMHASTGDHYYIIPGGRVDRDAAQKILQRDDCMAFDDGLFPNNPQSWKLVR